MIRFSVVTIFPELITSYVNESIIKRAQEKKLVEINVYNLRDWSTDKHNTVDDKIFGGSAGMLLKIEPLFNAVNELKKKSLDANFKPIVIATSASGELFNQKVAKRMSKETEDIECIILCGRYEGFDARIMNFVDLSYSIGPYILTGGELSSLVMIDAITRLIPNALGNPESIEEETEFSLLDGKLLITGEHPQYTRPEVFKGQDYKGDTHTLPVNKTLISGHHKKIDDFNKSQREKKIENID